jgi:hypothetical protein
LTPPPTHTHTHTPPLPGSAACRAKPLLQRTPRRLPFGTPTVDAPSFGIKQGERGVSVSALAELAVRVGNVHRTTTTTAPDRLTTKASGGAISHAALKSAGLKGHAAMGGDEARSGVSGGGGGGGSGGGGASSLSSPVASPSKGAARDDVAWTEDEDRGIMEYVQRHIDLFDKGEPID